ncbi:MAG: YidC/Oxa1 family membrane protein insertase [Acholeplasmataceae bacterium]
MKMYKKILFSLVAVLIVVLLAACQSNPKITDYVVNAPTKLVYTEDDAQDATNMLAKIKEGLSFYEVYNNGNIVLNEVDNNIFKPGLETTGVVTYLFSKTNEPFQIYIKPNDVDEDETEVVLVAFRLGVNNLKHNIGKHFDPTGLKIEIVRKNGTIETLNAEDYLDNFDTSNYEMITDEGFFKGKYPVHFNFEGEQYSFNVFAQGGQKPIHSADSGFFDWILVIPVAFIMQLFAGLMGNSFALGILFTTIVVRTLAWPIYAKSNDLSLKMSVAQPDIQRVQHKYATRRDPQAKQQMQMEIMAVYKKHNIKPLGCLLPFLQMPIFIAMYQVVQRITLEGGMYAHKVTNTGFLGIDLARGNDGFIGMVLAAIVGLTMLGLQYISMKKPAYAKQNKYQVNPQAGQTEKTMKIVSYSMVVMMVIFSYQSNALALYWIFGNIYSLGQTLFNRHINKKKHEDMKAKQMVV